MEISAISFGWPWAFLLLPLPLLVNRFFNSSEQGKSHSAAPSLPVDLAKTLSVQLGNDSNTSILRSGFIWLAWSLLIFAIAQPKMPYGVESAPASGRDVFMVMDMSGSMDKKDFVWNEVPATRLNVVKAIAGDFAIKRKGDRVGLILFADQAFVAAPLTFDTQSIKHFISEAEIGLAGRSTAIGDALGLSLKRLRESSSRSKVVVLLSDGSNNAGAVEPDSAATLAKTLRVRVHTIALGADEMTIKQFGEDTLVNPSLDLDEDALKNVAEVSGGKFYRARTTAGLTQVYEDIDELESSEAAAPPFVPERDLRHWPLLALFVLLLTLGIPGSRLSIFNDAVLNPRVS